MTTISPNHVAVRLLIHVVVVANANVLTMASVGARTDCSGWKKVECEDDEDIFVIVSHADRDDRTGP